MTEIRIRYPEIHEAATTRLNTLEEAVRREIEERIGEERKILLSIIADCEEPVEVPDEVVVEETSDEQPTEVVTETY